MASDEVLVIVTARLRLRPVRPGDADVLHAMWTLPGVRRFLWDDRTLDLEETREVLGRNEALFGSQGVGLWLAHVTEHEMPMGFAGYWSFHEPPRLELIYGLDDRWWGRGFATEAAAALVRFGFERRGYGAIDASIDTPNVASARVLGRLGFVPADAAPGARPNTSFFRLTRAAWARDAARVP